MIRTVGILGGNGMLGSDLVKFLGKDFATTAIDKENYGAHRGAAFDVLINANGNSRRFWANENPAEDFELSTVSVMRSFFDFHYKTYVYISSPDVYENPASPATALEHTPCDIRKLSPYGFHKRLGEELVTHYADNFLILRPAALLGTRLNKGIVYDITDENELYVTLDSRVQFITTDTVADIIKTLLEKKIRREVFNAGGVGTITPADVGVLAEKPVRVRDDAKLQQYEMSTEKIRGLYGALRTSQEYVKVFLEAQRLV